MKKLIITEFMSLDGVFEAPGPDGSGFKYEGWTFGFNNQEFGKFKYDELQQTEVLLLGRITYQGFAEAWPTQKDSVGFADKFNSMPKYVVSKTLQTTEWNNSHMINDHVIEEIQTLKNQVGGDIAVHGSGTLARFLLAHNLVDEVTILLYPVVLGIGKRLFTDMQKVDLLLIEAKPFETGVVALRYKPIYNQQPLTAGL